MKRLPNVAVLGGVLVLGGLLGIAAAQGKEVVYVDSAKATFAERAPGASIAVVWGDPEKGAYGAFTKFVPGITHPLHTHPSDIRIVVIKGAYLYKPEKGEEKRVAAGQYLFIPALDRHVSGGDTKEGALFYQESLGRFDINFVK